MNLKRYLETIQYNSEDLQDFHSVGTVINLSLIHI